MPSKTIEGHWQKHPEPVGEDFSDHPNHGYGTLSAPFVSALKHWKHQTISFLDFPGEIRNHVYDFLIYEPAEHYTELVDLDHRNQVISPPAALMSTCRELQTEILPLYFRTINLRLKYIARSHPQVNESHPGIKALRLYAGLNPSIVEHLRSLRLETSIVGCNIRVNDSRTVHVELYAHSDLIWSIALTMVSVAIRNKIIDSLVDSPTGLLGVKHFLIAHEEISQIREWHDWKQQKGEWAYEKGREALQCTKCTECTVYQEEYWYCRYCVEYMDYLEEQAAKEGMPRLILATTSSQDAAEMYD
jgi:hypothetical protein